MIECHALNPRTIDTMRYKHLIILVLGLCLCLATIGYYGYYPVTIGEPTGATLTYKAGSWREWEYRTCKLTAPQLAQLTDILKDTTPTVFFCEHTGVNNDDVLIALHYSNAEDKVFSLRSNRSLLYEGVAEDLTFLQQTCPDITNED